MKLLVVDDDPTFTELMVAELSLLGLDSVDVVHSGQDALDCISASQTPYDCYLVDVEMPGMNGVELCERITTNPLTKRAPVIMVSSSASLEHIDGAFAKGATDYLNKPLQRRELQGRMRMVQALATQTSKPTFTSDSKTDALDAVSLSEIPNCIDYLAMQNYVLKLGSLRINSFIAFGIHIVNLSDVFGNKDQSGQMDALMDVAEMISESFGGAEYLMSYAGQGDYVVLLPRARGFDKDAFEDQLELKFSELADWYKSAGEVGPVVQIGTPIYRNLLSFKAPDDLLDVAITGARSAQHDSSASASSKGGFL
ncbi:response regulator [Ruegeria profundi]|uniref:response regulator n=1 Tax=Ruegeria profundi TaxID=1685378 RepID=UPI001CD55904|nr:response regulator [Ruegeria profundi]MCA0928062.1 response regulator [Ruegeria profundi]